MAAPRRAYRYEPDVVREEAPVGVPGRVPRRKVGRKSSPLGMFLLLAVLPILLMLGSVYVHAVAAGLGGEAARLEDERARAEDEAERLEVRIAELSRPERVRSLAGGDLGMREPAGEDLKTLDGSHGEDATQNAEGDR